MQDKYKPNRYPATRYDRFWMQNLTEQYRSQRKLSSFQNLWSVNLKILFPLQSQKGILVNVWKRTFYKLPFEAAGNMGNDGTDTEPFLRNKREALSQQQILFASRRRPTFWILEMHANIQKHKRAQSYWWRFVFVAWPITVLMRLYFHYINNGSIRLTLLAEERVCILSFHLSIAFEERQIKHTWLCKHPSWSGSKIKAMNTALAHALSVIRSICLACTTGRYVIQKRRHWQCPYSGKAVTEVCYRRNKYDVP